MIETRRNQIDARVNPYEVADWLSLFPKDTVLFDPSRDCLVNEGNPPEYLLRSRIRMNPHDPENTVDVWWRIMADSYTITAQVPLYTPESENSFIGNPGQLHADLSSVLEQNGFSRSAYFAPKRHRKIEVGYESLPTGESGMSFTVRQQIRSAEEMGDVLGIVAAAFPITREVINAHAFREEPSFEPDADSDEPVRIRPQRSVPQERRAAYPPKGDVRISGRPGGSLEYRTSAAKGKTENKRHGIHPIIPVLFVSAVAVIAAGQWLAGRNQAHATVYSDLPTASSPSHIILPPLPTIETIYDGTNTQGQLTMKIVPTEKSKPFVIPTRIVVTPMPHPSANESRQTPGAMPDIFRHPHNPGLAELFYQVPTGMVYGDKIVEWAGLYGTNPQFNANMGATIFTIESCGNKDAQIGNPNHAAGIGQLMPNEFGGTGINLYDVETNARKSFTYFNKLLDEYHDPVVAAAAYNGGPMAAQWQSFNGTVTRADYVARYGESKAEEVETYVRLFKSIYGDAQAGNDTSTGLSTFLLPGSMCRQAAADVGLPWPWDPSWVAAGRSH